MVLKIIQDMENQFPYTLQEIMEICEFESIHTTRAYLSKVLPQSCVQRQGEKRGTRYNEATLNSFKVLKMLLEKKVLKTKQITAVMDSLGQQQINRIANGYEPLTVHVAIAGEVGGSGANTTLPSSPDQPVLLVEGNRVSRIDVSEKERQSAAHVDVEKWNVLPITKVLQIRFKGELTPSQREELHVATRILKSIVEG